LQTYSVLQYPKTLSIVINSVIHNLMATIIRRRGSKNLDRVSFRDEAWPTALFGPPRKPISGSQSSIAQDWEKAARQKRTMRQTQKVIDRLHEMISGERIARLSISEFVDSWLKTKKLETAPSTFTFLLS